jgi:hypothetical protein
MNESMIMIQDHTLGIAVFTPTRELGMLRYSLVLTDYGKWGLITDELDHWLVGFEAYRTGMLVMWSDPEFFTMFKLRWG